jgi:site-specific recombinase XerD
LFQEQVKINTVRNKEIKSTKHKKCELIKVHTARLTFISRCISEGMPLNEIMAMTGHSQITTLNKYVRAQPPKNMAKTDLYIKNPIYKDNKSMAFEEIDDSLEL